MNKRILITQRVERVEKINEIRESIDIRLIKLCLSIDLIPITVSNFIIDKYQLEEYLNNFDFDGIILSGGNNIGSFKERDNFESQLLSLSKINKIPVIGICRGLQMINHFQKGSLISIDGHCKTRHYIEGENFSPREVNSFHNYGIFKQNLGENLKPIAFADDGSIECIRHKFEPWLAIMWHPERENIFNIKDLEMFSSHFNKSQ